MEDLILARINNLAASNQSPPHIADTLSYHEYNHAGMGTLLADFVQGLRDVYMVKPDSKVF